MANDRRPTTNDLLLYYITDRTAFAADEPTRRRRLLKKIAEAARAGVDYIQLREKDLPTRELESLAREAVAVLNKLKAENRELKTALLINSRTDVALAGGAHGVHLRSEDISPKETRRVWTEAHVGAAAPRSSAAQSAAAPLIAVSCHSPEEVTQAAHKQATFAVFAPVFEKKDAPKIQASGVAQLREACKASIPVLALGGITLENAKKCIEAGAAGIAAIRLFQENDVSEVVKQIYRG
jgi:thiamine-phosphate pyrophosphorylase